MDFYQDYMNSPVENNLDEIKAPDSGLTPTDWSITEQDLPSGHFERPDIEEHTPAGGTVIDKKYGRPANDVAEVGRGKKMVDWISRRARMAIVALGVLGAGTAAVEYGTNVKRNDSALDSVFPAARAGASKVSETAIQGGIEKKEVATSGFVVPQLSKDQKSFSISLKATEPLYVEVTSIGDPEYGQVNGEKVILQFTGDGKLVTLNGVFTRPVKGYFIEASGEDGRPVYIGQEPQNESDLRGNNLIMATPSENDLRQMRDSGTPSAVPDYSGVKIEENDVPAVGGREAS